MFKTELEHWSRVPNQHLSAAGQRPIDNPVQRCWNMSIYTKLISVYKHEESKCVCHPCQLKWDCLVLRANPHYITIHNHYLQKKKAFVRSRSEWPVANQYYFGTSPWNILKHTIRTDTTFIIFIKAYCFQRKLLAKEDHRRTKPGRTKTS